MSDAVCIASFRSAWEPWLDHEWLAIDRDGHMGCFMSCCPEVLPADVSIPWPYLHNVLGAWVAFRRKCRLAELKWADRTFGEQVAMLADSGLFVWDAERETSVAETCFRLIAKPDRPIEPAGTDTYFSKIAKSFVAVGESFENTVRLHNVHFANEANITRCRAVNCSEAARPTTDEGALLELVGTRKAFVADVNFADRCRLEDAPPALGPTFSCWDAVRPSYLRLMERIAEVLSCSCVEVRELTGKGGTHGIAELHGLTKEIPLPFLSVDFCRHDGRCVRVSFRPEYVTGGSSWLSSGYLPGYESEMHVEYWQFELTAVSPARWNRPLSRLLAMLGRRFVPNSQIVNRFVL